MKQALVGGYTFAPAARTLDFAGTAGFDVRRLFAVVNLASGALIYAAGKPGLGYANTAGTSVTLQFDTSGMSSTDALLVLYDASNGATDGKLEEMRVLLSGAATAARQDTGNASLTAILAALGPLGTDATLQQILAAVRAQRVETIWTDDTGARFIRVDIGGPIVWTDVAGSASSAPGAGARPDSDSGTVVSRSTYRATATGTGFAVGDVLDHIVVTDGDAGDLVSNFWVNVTAGTKIAAPSAASISPQSPLPDGAATAARQDTGNAALGAPADTAATSDAGSFSLVALAKRALGNWTTLLARVPALVGGRVPVDGSAVTQPISATSLPLPAGAALDATITARLGTLGQKAMAASTPVAIASDQGQVPISINGFTTQIPVAVNSLPSVSASPTTTQVPVATGSSASQILAAGRADIQVVLKNTGTVRAYIGGSGVSASTGFPLGAGEQIVMDTKVAQGVISAVLDSGQATAGQISVLRF